ncbi:hypothetical protein [Paenibacillus humicola]|uniref:hypothetical protein n=1 Tax=Paenibacillus humicola TaxID=3110540 RepID=UPI00237B1DB4|nr:hypothetical protein [Paenibacillus humicola]
MKIIQRKSGLETGLPASARLHPAFEAEKPETETDALKQEERNFRFGLFNGALIVTPFWIVVIWFLFFR